MIRRAAAALVLLAVAGCGVSRPPADATGDEIYRMLCANCHGAALEGRIGPPLGPGSNTAEQPDDFIELTLIHGRGRMPSFRSSLDDAQIRRLIDYIREVQRG